MFVLRNNGFFSSSNDENTTFDVAVQGGDAVNAVEDLRNAVVKGVKVTTALVVVCFLLFFVVVPAGYVLGVWFSRKRALLVKYMKKTPLDLANPNQYLLYKKHIERLSKRTTVLTAVSSIDLKNVPLVVKYPVRKMKHISSTLLTYNGWLKSRLSTYNQEQFCSEQKIFSFKSESDLWNSRNKAYAYWM